MDSVSEPVTVLIVDDHPVLRFGVRKLLEAEPDILVIGEASGGAEALKLVQALKPRIVLLDLALPERSGMDVLRDLAALNSGTSTIIFAAAVGRADMARAFQLGARGIVLKESGTDFLVEGIRAVARGDYWVGRETVSDLVHVLRSFLPASHGPHGNKFGLSARELQVVAEVMGGYSNKEIAQRLALSEQTVKHHITNIFDKTGASNRMELTLFAVNHHLVDSE